MRRDDHLRRLRSLLSPALAMVILVVGIQQVADLDEAWSHLEDIGRAELLLLGAATALNLATYWLLLTAALPGLTLGQAAASCQASTAASNALPAGAAIGAGITWAMYRSYGFTPLQASSAMTLTGFWNTVVKLATPPVAIAVLAAGTDAPPVGVAVASGMALVALLSLSRWLLSSEAALRGMARSAAWVGRLRQTHFADAEARLRQSRREFATLLHHRWLALSTSATASHLALFALLIICIRSVGVSSAEVSVGEALSVFALVRVALIVPITPGGAGIAEVGYAALLSAFGADPATSVAAVVLFRSLTWLLPIPVGGVVYLAWSRSTHRVSAEVAR